MAALGRSLLRTPCSREVRGDSGVRETDYQVRVIVIDGEPWFVLVDLCRVLGAARSASNLTQQIDPDGLRQAYRIIDNLGRTQHARTAPEAHPRGGRLTTCSWRARRHAPGKPDGLPALARGRACDR